MRSAARAVAALGLAALALAACDRLPGQGQGQGQGERAAGSGYNSRISADASGEYAPVQPVTVGGRALRGLYIGRPEDFAAWERGERMAGYAPIMLMLDDARVEPRGYRVTDETLAFDGEGGVRLTARIDQDALSTARRNLGDEGAVVTGTLTVGGRTAPVSLRLQGGG